MNNLTKRVWSAVLGFLLLVLPVVPVSAASLWDDGGPAGLFSDRRARAVGDSLTIIINESSNASRSGSSDNSKSASADASAGTGIFHFIAAASAESNDKFSSKGAITNRNTVTGQITVQVVDIKPNGNLVVSGTQTINQNGEEQRITVTGVVRPDDIYWNNTIQSSYVADAKLKIEGKGPLANKQRQGILTQIFNFLF